MFKVDEKEIKIAIKTNKIIPYKGYEILLRAVPSEFGTFYRAWDNTGGVHLYSVFQIPEKAVEQAKQNIDEYIKEMPPKE